MKLVSLVLAALIWFTIRSGIEPSNLVTRQFQHIPITVMTMAADARAFKVDPNDVEVTVSGELNRLQTLGPQDIVVFVNLTDIQRTRGLVKKIEVHIPTGLSLVQVYPATVRVEPAAPAPNAPAPKAL
ncbi:MAG: CdaR family protein [Limisphaerales bacterium]